MNRGMFVTIRTNAVHPCLVNGPSILHGVLLHHVNEQLCGFQPLHHFELKNVRWLEQFHTMIHEVVTETPAKLFKLTL